MAGEVATLVTEATPYMTAAAGAYGAAVLAKVRDDPLTRRSAWAVGFCNGCLATTARRSRCQNRSRSWSPTPTTIMCSPRYGWRSAAS